MKRITVMLNDEEIFYFATFFYTRFLENERANAKINDLKKDRETFRLLTNSNFLFNNLSPSMKAEFINVKSELIKDEQKRQVQN